jgi:hypothetical protein
MKKLGLFLTVVALMVMLCVPALAFEKVDVTGTNFETDVIFRAKIVTFLEQLNFTELAITDALNNGRQIHWQFTATAIESGEQLQGIQLRSSWGGTADSVNGGITGIEIKARAASDSITHTLGQARAIVGNVDVKKATFSKGYCFEAAVDVSAGGTIAEAIGFRAFLNNSGTVTNGYAFYVDAESGYPWKYGLYVEDGMATTGIYISGGTTGIQLTGTLATAASRAIKSAVTINDGNLGDGYGTNEFDLTITGTGAGHIAATSSWVNVPSGTHGAGGTFIVPLTVGVYEADAATITDSTIIFGMRMQAIITDTDAARLCPLDINVSGDTIDAIWNAPTKTHLGYAEDATTDSTKCGDIPFMIDSNGAVFYIRIYDSAS